MTDDLIDDDPTADHPARGQVMPRRLQAGRGWGDLPVDPDLTPSDLTPSDGPGSEVASGSEIASGRGEGDPATGRTAAAPVRAPVRRRGRARVRYVSRRLRRVVGRRGDILAVIAAGGAAGSLARWGLTQLLPHPVGTFPWATFTANVSGCLLLGVLMVFVIEVWPPSRYVRPFLGVGVLGGYTTFSTYMLDTRALLVSGRAGLAGEYVFATLAAGLAAVWVGVTGARLLVRLARRRAGHRHTDRPHPAAASSASSSSPSVASMTRST
jgi:CrcB protein